jgi:hypothetical protein
VKEETRVPTPRSSIAKEISVIRRSFAAIDAALARLAVSLPDANRFAEGRADATPRRKLHLSPARRAQLKLQGVYMTYVRQLKPRQRAQVTEVREKRGFEAAIRAAKRMAKG